MSGQGEGAWAQISMIVPVIAVASLGLCVDPQVRDLPVRAQTVRACYSGTPGCAPGGRLGFWRDRVEARYHVATASLGTGQANLATES